MPPVGQPSAADGPGEEPSGPHAQHAGRAGRTALLVDLITSCARGHEDAFRVLYDETCSRIYGIVLRILHSPDLAAEVTQDVYTEIWRQAARYSPEKGSVLTWMVTVAHRRAVDRVRSVASETSREDRYAALTAEPQVDRVWEAVERRMESERVRRAMASLTDVQREALSLAYFGGYTQTQVAALLQLPLGTVKSRMRDGLIGLRDALGVGS
jgi:RNA polymerase sigma-70 factor (ECF subfamily)